MWKTIITTVFFILNGMFAQNITAQTTNEDNVEQPRFPGCENKNKVEACAKEKLLRYVYSNLNYPSKARNEGIDGVVELQFIVDTQGDIQEIEILSSPHPSMDKECIKVLEKMKKDKIKWIPGKKNGEPSNMLYTMPMKFKLHG